MDVLVDNIELGRGGGTFCRLYANGQQMCSTVKKKKEKGSLEKRKEKKKKKKRRAYNLKTLYCVLFFFLQNRSKNNIEEAG